MKPYFKVVTLPNFTILFQNVILRIGVSLGKDLGFWHNVIHKVTNYAFKYTFFPPNRWKPLILNRTSKRYCFSSPRKLTLNE